MKLVIQVLLSFFLSLLFLLGTTKLLLSYNFWINALEKADAYGTIAEEIKQEFRTKINTEGGGGSPTDVLENLITKENVEDLINKNIYNTTAYLNGKSGDYKIYIPVNKIPRDLTNDGLRALQEEYEFKQFATGLGLTSVGNMNIESLRNLGTYVNYSILATLILMSLLIFADIRLTKPGNGFKALGVSFMLDGFGIFLLVYSSKYLLDAYLLGRSEDIVKVIVENIMLPVIYEIQRYWMFYGAVPVIFGILFFVFRKPSGRT